MRIRRAFTLVELLVVIGIIAALLSILMPALASARASARCTQCASNMRQLGVALTNYASDSRGRFPPNLNSPSPGMYWYDADRIGGYLSANIVLSSGKTGENVLQCPNDDGGERSYAMNIWASSLADSIADPTRGVTWDATVSKGPAMVLLIEALSTTGAKASGYFAPATVGYSGVTAAQRFGAAGGISPAISGGRWGSITCQLDYARHRQSKATVGRLNVCYSDGHVTTEASDAFSDASGNLTGGALWSPKDSQ